MFCIIKVSYVASEQNIFYASECQRFKSRSLGNNLDQVIGPQKKLLLASHLDKPARQKSRSPGSARFYRTPPPNFCRRRRRRFKVISLFDAFERASFYPAPRVRKKPDMIKIDVNVDGDGDADTDADTSIKKGNGNHRDGCANGKVDADVEADDGVGCLEKPTHGDEFQSGTGSRRILLLKTLVLDFGLAVIDLVTDLFQAGWLKSLTMFNRAHI